MSTSETTDGNATTKLEGNPIKLCGNAPQVGQQLADFTLVGKDLTEVKLADFTGKNLIISVFPSVDTGICARQVATFNQRVGQMSDAALLCISMDLPFALGRFCGAEGIDKATVASAFRSSFGDDYGLKMCDGPLAGLLARTVIVADKDGKVIYSRVCDEIKTEPDYDEALAALA